MPDLILVSATGGDSARALADLDERLAALTVDGRFPDCTFVFYDASLDDDALAACLRARLPGVPIIAEQGQIEVSCDFCGQQERFDAVDVGRLFTPAAQRIIEPYFRKKTLKSKS